MYATMMFLHVYNNHSFTHYLRILELNSAHSAPKPVRCNHVNLTELDYLRMNPDEDVSLDHVFVIKKPAVVFYLNLLFDSL